MGGKEENPLSGLMAVIHDARLADAVVAIGEWVGEWSECLRL